MHTLILSALLAASPAPRVVAPDWVVSRAEPALAAFYAEELARLLRAQGVAVVTAQELAVLVGQERQRELLGCSGEASCLTELSSAIGCDGTLVVNLTRLDDALTANLKVLSTRDGRALAEARAEAGSERDFRARLEAAAASLADQLLPERRARAQATRALVPAVVGGAVLLAGGVSLALAWNQGRQLDAELARAHAVTPAAQTLARDGRALEVAGWCAAGIGMAGLAAAGALALWAPPAPVQASATVLPGGGAVALQGVWP